MRHKHKRILELNTGTIKTSTVVRNMLTNLIENGKMQTTSKRSRVLKAFADSFFARLVRIQKTKEPADARRESIRYISSVVFGDTAGKKVLDEILPRFVEEGHTTWFVTNYKLWFRPWDGAEKVLVTLV